MTTARYTSFPPHLERTMGEVEERTWTCIAASHEDADGSEIIDSEKIGRRTITRHVYFGFKAEAEAWLDEQATEGFHLRSGIASAATFYHGPTDAPGNCWSVEVEREQPLAKLAPGELDPRD